MQIGVPPLPDRVPDPTSTDPGAQTSGPGFDRMIAAAQAEADRRKAIADKSGASADQFTEQSWLAIMQAHGAEIGLGAATGKITKDSHGELTVIDPVLRAKVINYRNDPLVRSIMAVKRAGDGKAVLNAELGRQPTDAEMRAAEAIGPRAAAKLITTRQSTPNASAALVSPDAAKANRAVFYRPDGSPQTVNEVLVKLMKPADSPAGPDVGRLAASHAALNGTAVPSAVAAPQLPGQRVMQGQGLTPEMAANLRARAAFASATAPAATAPKPKAQRQAPPDLALVGGTIGNLSMPGAARGVTAPTGGKISGWRGQMAGEVTHQIEHPESLVTNAPSKVTIPAPDPSHHAPVDQYATASPAMTATAAAPVAVTPTQQLGPQLAPSPAPPQPIPPVAFAPPVSSVPQSAPPAALPTLVTGAPVAPTSALPLLPIDDTAGPMVLSPQGTAGPIVLSPQGTAGPIVLSPQGTAPAMTPVAIGADPAEPQIAPVAVRPSRYGPAANRLMQRAPTQSLGYAAASPLLQTQAISDAASAGIRPSRYYASTVQQLAALSRPQPQAPQIQQSVAPTSVAAPVVVQAALGPDGLPILPPVPGPAGLPPITASEALQPGGPNQTMQAALLEGTKPLDLAPSMAIAPAAPAVAAQPVPATARPPRPRLTPPSRF